MELATFGGGCFWCVEAAFEELEGVESVTSGYAGGETEDPTYEAVCSGRTGHAEVVQLEYDPGRIAYADLLEVFFTIHDPTTLNREGPDVGSQYRSAIYAHDDDQLETAAAFVDELEAEGVYEDRHRDRTARDVLRGRGVPPELLREEPDRRLLSDARSAESRESSRPVRRERRPDQ